MISDDAHNLIYNSLFFFNIVHETYQQARLTLIRLGDDSNGDPNFSINCYFRSRRNETLHPCRIKRSINHSFKAESHFIWIGHTYCTDDWIGFLVCINSLQWRHNERGGISDHQPRDCLLDRLFRCRSKKTSKVHVTGLCTGSSEVTGEFPHQGAVTRKMFPFDDVIMFWTHWRF